MEKDSIQNAAQVWWNFHHRKSVKANNLYNGEQQCELLVDGGRDLHQTLAFRQNPVLSDDLIKSDLI